MLVRAAALALIRRYQRYLSPLKGFACAYRVHTGCASCSALGYRAIRRHGVWRGLALLDQRLERCGVAYRRHLDLQARIRPLAAQRGDCDCGLPGDGCGDAVDVCDCIGCDGCDRKSKRRNRPREGRAGEWRKAVYVPPPC